MNFVFNPRLETALGLASRLPKPPSRRERVLVLANDPAVISAADSAARAERRGPPTFVRSGREALAQLAAPGDALPHLVCDPAAVTSHWPQVLANLSDPSGNTKLVLMSANDGGDALPPDGARLASELRLAAAPPAPLPPEPGAALREGMARGEIAVRYQPIVRVSDREPVMLEALARWHRDNATIPPAAFVPVAEKFGLLNALSAEVTRCVARDLPVLPRPLSVGVSVNLSLPLLLSSDLLTVVERTARRTGLRPAKLLFELTESAEVEDRSALRRTLVRLRAAGHGVLLDDLGQRDERRPLLDLPFTGFKLDRRFVEAMPDDASARHEARSLMRHAEAHSQIVVAEGVSDERVWRTVRGLGIHLAQGFAVGRPLPPAALPVWLPVWRACGPARGVNRRDYAKTRR
jgi:EAL domain-containing protein (putative c-di-GMP-specific phosphodiesterase class I)